MRSVTIDASAPFRLMRTALSCPHCGRATAVVALIAAATRPADGKPNRVPARPSGAVVLHDVVDLPYDLLQVVRAGKRGWIKPDTHLEDAAGYRNTCDACRASIADEAVIGALTAPSGTPDAVELLDLPVIGTLRLQADWTDLDRIPAPTGDRA